MNNLYKLGKKHPTDKISYHGYDRFYEDFLYKYKKRQIKLLEIGFLYGDSIKLWLDYFKKAEIYAIEADIKLYKKYKKNFDKRLTLIYADQSNISDLKNIVKLIDNCEVIIDDGSHVPEHQLLSFNYLFENCLKEGGVYIIEDIETSYWKKGELYGYNVKAGPKSKKNIVNIFRIILPIVNREFLTNKEKKELYKTKYVTKYVLDNISSINFGMNCIIIKKMSNFEKRKFGDREYRFERYL